jgi:hypothetical protein
MLDTRSRARVQVISQLTKPGKPQQAEAVCRCRAGREPAPAAPPSEQEQVLIKGVRTFQHRLKHPVSTRVPTANSVPNIRISDQRRCPAEGLGPR